ncbi:MAG TPA: PDZ domain-containing protein [bacterium]|nr:PDZ domain-containing protein [bacterium]
MKSLRLFLLLAPVLALASAVPAGQSTTGDSSAVKRGWLGVYTDELSKPMLAALDVDHGVLVTEVADGSPAAKAGVEVGDVITSLDGAAASDGSALRWAVRDRPGQRVTLKVRRRGREKALDVTLATREEAVGTFDFEWPALPGEALREVGRALQEAGPTLKRELDGGEAIPGLRRELEQSGLTVDSLRGQMQELRNELNELRDRLGQKQKSQ